MNKLQKITSKGVLVAGEVVKDPRELITLASRTISGVIEGKGRDALYIALNKLVDDDKIEPDITASAKARYFVPKIDSQLKSEKDEDILMYKIQLFLAVISKKFQDHSDLEAKKIWDIVNRLDEADIITLGAVKIIDDRDSLVIDTAGDDFAELVTKETNLKHKEFVSDSLHTLRNQSLISKNTISDPNLLTGLGRSVAEYLEHGKSLYESVQ